MFFNRDDMKMILCDANHLLGNGRLLSWMLSANAFCQFYVGAIVEIQEHRRQLYIIEMNYLICKNQLYPPLSKFNLEKWLLRTNLVTKYLMRQTFYFTALIAHLVVISPIVDYFLFNANYSIFNLVSWTILQSLLMVHFYSSTILAGIIYYCYALYLRLKFNEIHNRIVFSYIFGLKSHLKTAITEHNSASIITAKVNHTLKHGIFIVYYFGVPAIEILLDIITFKTNSIVVRLAFLLLFIILFTLCSLTNYWSAGITKSAHKSYKILFKILVSNRFNLTVRERLKIESFLQTLSGKPIGFYCLDFFPMTGFKFAEFLYFCGATYILIVGFANRMK